MSNKIKPNARKSDLVVQDAGNEVLVYDLVTNKASYLNETSAFVWQNCNGVNGIADIAEALGRKTNQAVNDEFVWLAIDQLSKNNLLEDKVAANVGFAGMSRREVIKKVGLGTMVALPLVASLIAPQVAHANSRCVTVRGGCSCVPNNGGVAGQPCQVATPCADSANCVCSYHSNGNSAVGDCLP